MLRGLVGALALSLVAWWSALLVIQALMRAAVVQTTAEGYAEAQARAQTVGRPAPPQGDAS